MFHIQNDLRFAVRQVQRAPGLTIVAVIALALGIGLTTSVFSFVYGILLRGLPFEEPQQIVHIDRTNVARDVNQMPATIHDFEDWRDRNKSLAEIGAYYYGTVNLSGNEKPERYSGAFITPNTFDLLRVKPFLGRLFQPADDAAGAPQVIILSHAVWRARFAEDPNIIGKSIRANGQDATVVGVMPEKFEFPYVQQLWMPLRMTALSIPRGTGQEIEVVGRLRPGVSLDAANADLNAIARQLQTEHPETNDGVGVVAQSFIKSIAGEGVAMLYTMLGAVFLVLLVACANVANLLLARAAGRAREIGIRTALGAARSRIVSQFITEAFVLAAIGGVLGTAVAFLGVDLLNDTLSTFEDLPFFVVIKVDAISLVFVLATTLIATMAAGILPAVQAARAEAGDVLKDEARGASSFRIGRVSRTVVVVELAMSCGLLVGSGLMIRSVTNLRRADFGFHTANVFTARIALPDAAYSDEASQLQFYDELQRKIAALPGVKSAALSSNIPVAISLTPLTRDPFAVEGVTYPRESDYKLTGAITITPDYFKAFDVAPTRGRGITTEDRADTRPVAVVNESFAARFFAGQTPVGRRIRMGGSKSQQPWRTIVGVVPDMYVSGPDNKTPEGIYIPLSQSPARFASIIVRTTADPAAMTAPVREAVRQLNADMPIYHVHSMAEAIHKETLFYRLFGGVFTVLGSAALILASVGLYAVMAFSVKRRTREMGIRMALGASLNNIVRLVVGQGLRQVTIGLVIGLALAAAISKGLAMMLFEVEPNDPIVFAGVIATLALSGILACLVPAIRASRVNPMVAIRVD